MNDLKTQIKIDSDKQQILIQQLTAENSKLKSSIEFEQERARLLQSFQNDLFKKVNFSNTSTKLDNTTKVLSIGTTLVSLCFSLHNIYYGKPVGDMESSFKEIKELILTLKREDTRRTAYERRQTGVGGLAPVNISLQDIDNYPRS